MAQMRQNVQHMSNLFSDIHRLGLNGDYEGALRVVNKILHMNADDETAFHCKIVCFLQLGKFEEAAAALNKNHHMAGGLIFEKAYCEYRLNRTADALRTLDTATQMDQRLKELRGQVLYRLEQYDECSSIYKDLVKHTQDEFDEERETNLSAVMASLQMWSTKDIDPIGLREDTYELCYNSACMHLGKNQHKDAIAKLRRAEELCRKMFEEDGDTTEEEVDAELGVVRVQLGYTLQQIGKNEEAMKLYNQVLKKRPIDAVLAAIASNNVITLNKEQNVFDSKKKIKVCTASGLQNKLLSNQRRAIAMNQCLLAMYTNQGEECCRLAERLRKAYPDSDTPTLIEVAQKCRDLKVPAAVQLLKTRMKSTDASLQLILTQAQLHLVAGNVNEACSLLRSFGDDQYRLAVVSTLVRLYVSDCNVNEAIGVLDAAVKWYRSNKTKSEECITLMRATVSFLLEHGKAESATVLLEELRKKKPNDLKTMAQLIAAYSKFDPQKAQLVSRELPSSTELSPTVDVDQLESSIVSLGPKYIKKTAKGLDSAKTGSPQGAGDLLLQKKKRKKKKTILPKNCDPSVTPDPERWLPRRERSYYRGKRRDKRKEIGKGTQGSAVTDSEMTKTPVSTVTPAPASVESPTAQRPPRGVAAKQKKKKKGGKW